MYWLFYQSISSIMIFQVQYHITIFIYSFDILLYQYLLQITKNINITDSCDHFCKCYHVHVCTLVAVTDKNEGIVEMIIYTITTAMVVWVLLVLGKDFINIIEELILHEHKLLVNIYFSYLKRHAYHLICIYSQELELCVSCTIQWVVCNAHTLLQDGHGEWTTAIHPYLLIVRLLCIYVLHLSCLQDLFTFSIFYLYRVIQWVPSSTIFYPDNKSILNISKYQTLLR